MDKLPENAKKVFDGKIFEVWQWQQPVYDGSTKTFEALKRPNTAQSIAVVGEKILIIKQEQPHKDKPFLSLPGGRCEGDEDPLMAAKRELLEETGYSSDNWKLWRQQNPYAKIIWTVFTYIAKDCRKTQEPNPDFGEKLETRLYTFDQFIDLAEDTEFYEKELQCHLIKAKYDKRSREELRREIFG